MKGEGGVGWADVVEETLRWDAPVSYFPFRYPVRDLTVDGTVIPKGTPVLAGYSAAGRDFRSVHGPDADRFDVTRPARSGAARHLSSDTAPPLFLGAPLARMEATIALERLFTRFPDLDLAVTEAELCRRSSSSATACGCFRYGWAPPTADRAHTAVRHRAAYRRTTPHRIPAIRHRDAPAPTLFLFWARAVPALPAPHTGGIQDKGHGRGGSTRRKNRFHQRNGPE